MPGGCTVEAQRDTHGTACAKAQRQEKAMLPGEMEISSESWMGSVKGMKPRERQGWGGQQRPDQLWIYKLKG